MQADVAATPAGQPGRSGQVCARSAYDGEERIPAGEHVARQVGGVAAGKADPVAGGHAAILAYGLL
jgi:hypothetical protein